MRASVAVNGSLNAQEGSVGWTVELALPWSLLRQAAGSQQVPPKAGDQWRINFSRVHWNVTWDQQQRAYIKARQGQPLAARRCCDVKADMSSHSHLSMLIACEAIIICSCILCKIALPVVWCGSGLSEAGSQHDAQLLPLHCCSCCCIVLEPVARGEEACEVLVQDPADQPGYNWVWSPQWQVAMHQPETWGYLQFADTPGATAGC